MRPWRRCREQAAAARPVLRRRRRRHGLPPRRLRRGGRGHRAAAALPVRVPPGRRADVSAATASTRSTRARRASAYTRHRRPAATPRSTPSSMRTRSRERLDRASGQPCVVENVGRRARWRRASGASRLDARPPGIGDARHRRRSVRRSGCSSQPVIRYEPAGPPGPSRCRPWRSADTSRHRRRPLDGTGGGLSPPMTAARPSASTGSRSASQSIPPPTPTGSASNCSPRWSVPHDPPRGLRLWRDHHRLNGRLGPQRPRRPPAQRLRTARHGPHGGGTAGSGTSG